MSLRVVGVDGGGSRTRAILLDESGAVLRRLEGEGSAVDPGDPSAAAARVEGVVRRLAREAGASLPADALVVGLAGAGRAPLQEAVTATLREAGLARRILVETDADIAFRDAFGAGPGILLVAGTGSVAWGRAEDGRRDRVGGWGPLLGDEGSGYTLGVEAMRRVARSVDGRGPDTGLRDTLPRALGLPGAEALVGWVAGASRREVAALVPLVAEAAVVGDEVAETLLREGVEELIHHALVLRDRLGPWTAPPPLALAGGLLDPEGPLRARIEAALDLGSWRIHPPRVDGARGAGRAALELCLHD